MSKRIFVAVAIPALIAAGLIWLVATWPSTPHPTAVQLPISPQAPSSELQASVSTSTRVQATGTASGVDRSSLHLGSGGNMMLLTDPLSRQTGYEMTTARVVQQIPNSNFSSEGTTNIEDTNYPASIDYFIDIHKPLDGEYQLTLTGGQQSESYDLTMATFSKNGARQSSGELKGSLVPGSNKLFQIYFTSAPDTSSTIRSIN
jgi:hypothetical protein